MDPNQPTSLPHIASAVLNDLKCYLMVIEPVVYQAPMDILSGSTIGQHTRHIIEFYNCLLEQYHEEATPIINYAKRRRDYQIESEPDHALRCVGDIGEKLMEIDASKTCLLDSSEHGLDQLIIPSTVARELVYNIEHTIHHLAIVKIALKSVSPLMDLPAHFGVAPSTIRHRLESCAQ